MITPCETLATSCTKLYYSESDSDDDDDADDYIYPASRVEPVMMLGGLVTFIMRHGATCSIS